MSWKHLESYLVFEYFSISSVWERRWCWGCCPAPAPSLALSGCWRSESRQASSRFWRDLDPCAWSAPRFCGGASCLRVLCPGELPFSQKTELKTLGRRRQTTTLAPCKSFQKKANVNFQKHLVSCVWWWRHFLGWFAPHQNQTQLGLEAWGNIFIQGGFSACMTKSKS